MDRLAYNDDRHEYRLHGKLLPSVTHILGDMMPGWKAGQWYLDRGKAVHAAAAMILRGQAFEHDPVIAGQVAACRRFVREWAPRTLDVEKPVYSERYKYAGTLDAIVECDGVVYILDWKASFSKSLPLQLAAYALANDEMHGTNIRRGIGVQLTEDGTYRTEVFGNIATYKMKWKALLQEWKNRKGECNEG